MGAARLSATFDLLAVNGSAVMESEEVDGGGAPLTVVMLIGRGGAVFISPVDTDGANGSAETVGGI